MDVGPEEKRQIKKQKIIKKLQKKGAEIDEKEIDK